MAIKIKLNIHEQSVHDIEPELYKCDQCGTSSLTQNSLTQHIRLNHGKPKAKPVEPFVKRVTRVTGKKILHDENVFGIEDLPESYKCEHCNSKYSTKFSLKRHINNDHKGIQSMNTRAKRVKRETGNQDQPPTQMFESKELEAEFLDFLKLENPLEGKIVEKKLSSIQQCLLCDYSDSNKTVFSMHMKAKHMIDDEYRCDHCEAAFLVYRELFFHLTDSHGIGNYDSQCNVCGKGFKNSTSLNKHKEIHEPKRSSKTKKISCEKCGKSFTSDLGYNYHMACTHGEFDIKPEDEVRKCSQCNQKFEEPSSMKTNKKNNRTSYGSSYQ